jgi:hypothetical protein
MRRVFAKPLAFGSFFAVLACISLALTGPPMGLGFAACAAAFYTNDLLNWRRARR